MTNSEENELAEKIATLLDKYLDTSIDDMTHINELIQKEKKEARLEQQFQNNLDAVNGGSK
jgi:hypothetical protein